MMDMGLGLLFGLVGTRRRRRGHTGVAAFATVLVGSAAQGCCDPMVATDTSSMGESSSTGDEGSTNPISTGESSTVTGEPALPEWALGFFTSASAMVGMTWDAQEGHLWYPWGNIEIDA